MNKNVIYAALMFVVTMSSGNASAQQLPYQNPALSAHERAVDLCGRLTLEEKASLMLDDSPAIPRLGIKRFQWWSEALHGVANMGDVTVFPEPIGMAASFNDRMVYRVFDATSDEMRAKWNELQQKGGDVTRFHALSVWTPNVNIFRDPRWGRGQETYGEDPYLTSRMGCAVVRGLQGPEDTKYRKLWACAKHYAIHPRKKQIAGMRLALLALDKTYGIKGITSESACYKNVEFKGDTAVVSFDRAGMWIYGKNGLKSDLVEVAGADSVFHPAKAWIERSKLYVKSDKVKNPVSVRYAFKDWADGDLFCDGLPISSFRTDDWKK